MRYLIRTVLLAAGLFFASPNIYAGTVTARASGNWSNTATWVSGNIPGNGDDVIIPSAYSVSLTADASCKSLTVDGSFDGGTYVLTLSGTGAVTINGSFRTAHQNGFTGGALSSNNSPTITLGNASTIEYYGTGYQVITVRDYANLTISGNRNAAWLSIGAGTIGIAGTFTHSATNVNYNNGSEINYKGSGQTIAVFSYNGLNLTGATGVSFPAATVVITGIFNPGATTSAAQGSINFAGSGQTVPAFQYNNLDLSNGSGISFATSGIIAVRGSFTTGYTNSATSGSTIRFNGTNQTVPAFGYHNLDLTGASATAFATSNYPGIDIYGSFTPGSVTSATAGSYFNFKGSAGQAIPAFSYHHLDLNNTAHSFPAGTVAIAGNFTNASNNNPTQGTISFNGSNQSLQSSFNFFNLDVSGASNISFTNYTIGIAGSFNPGNNNSAGTNYTMNFTGTNQTVPAFSYYNLNLTGSTNIGFANGIIGIGNAFTPGPVTTITQGTIRFTGSSPSIPAITYYGLDISSPGDVWLPGGQTYTINGPFTTGSGTSINLNSWTNTTFNVGGTLNYNSTGGQSIQFLTLNLTNSGTMSGMGSGTMPNITIAPGATRTLTGNFNLTSNATLTVNGTLNAASYAVTGSGATTVNSTATVFVGHPQGLGAALSSSGTRTIAAGARYEFNGTATQTTGFVGVTMGAPASITVSNSTGDVSLDADVTMGNNASFVVNSGGRFNAGTRKISFGTGGTATINGIFRTANTDGLSGGATTTFTNTNTPAITLAAGSTIDYAASAAQVVTLRNDYHHLSLSNGNKSLAGATSIAGNATLSGGAKLLLGSNNFTIGGTMSGDASNFVVTDGAGSVILKSVTGSGKQFAIGASTTSYSPLTIQEGSGLDWTVNVKPGNSPSIVTQQDNIQRTWTITPSTNPTPLNTTLVFQYNEGDAGIQGSNWSTSGYVDLKRHNGSAWVLMGTVVPGGTAGGIRTVTATGYRQFSPWIVAKGSGVLPVTLLRFSGKREGSVNRLDWTTATESGNRGFEVERSADGRTYTAIGTVSSRANGGNSSTALDYSFSDNNAPKRAFYRIRQNDISGATHYSATILLEEKPTQDAISGLYPVPAGDRLLATVHAAAAGKALIRIIDAGGTTVQLREQHLSAGANAVSLDLARLPAGVWLLQVLLPGNEKPQSARFTKY